jgi:hypothetical protein
MHPTKEGWQSAKFDPLGSALYEQFWGRPADLILHPKDGLQPHVDVYRFPPAPHGRQLPDAYAYITGGMSDLPMKYPDATTQTRVELTAFSRRLYKKNTGEDFLASILLWMARYPFANRTVFAPWQTFAVGKPLVPGSDMTGYFFTETPNIDGNGLFDSCPDADGFVHLVPISDAERVLIVEKGREEIFRIFADKNVGPFFDLDRRSAV